MLVDRPFEASTVTHLLAGGDPKDLLTHMWRCFGALQFATAWSDETLFERLGCQMGPTGPSAEADARHSIGYLTWLLEISALVDRVEDKRAIVTGAFRVVRGAPGGTAGERLAATQGALARVPDDPTQREGRELLELGEVTAAWRSAARQLGSGEAFERALRLDRIDGGDDPLRAHVNPRRMQSAVGPDAHDEIGPNVVRAIAEHCKMCSACDELRLRALAESPQPVSPASSLARLRVA